MVWSLGWQVKCHGNNSNCFILVCLCHMKHYREINHISIIIIRRCTHVICMHILLINICAQNPRLYLSVCYLCFVQSILCFSVQTECLSHSLIKQFLVIMCSYTLQRDIQSSLAILKAVIKKIVVIRNQTTYSANFSKDLFTIYIDVCNSSELKTSEHEKKVNITSTIHKPPDKQLFIQNGKCILPVTT